jgi:foldase protein PrsA
MTAIPTQTERPLPSETAIPLAALVNREVITLADFESELSRFQDSRGTDLATVSNSSETVLQALIDRLLLAQGARSRGIAIGDSDINAEIERLIVEIGSVDSYLGWLETNHYTEATFKQALAIEMYASKMIELILLDVPEIELQAHARHILVGTEEEAEGIQQQIVAGTDFGELAALYSLDLSTKPGGGDLGWFARGTLTAPQVEEVIFNQPPGDTTAIVASNFGFHVVQLIALEERMLSYESLLARQEQAVENWLLERIEKAELEVLIDD